MKDVATSLLQRVSIRKYTDEPIPQEAMNQIYSAIENTPTSYNGQQFTVIDITDQPLKEKLYEITGQKQIMTCKHFLVFCVDFNKVALLAKDKGLEMPKVTNTMDGVIVGVIDTSLAMMSAVVMAESLGLGSNCIGYLRTADPAQVADLLKLPRGVFVVCGLAIGYPAQSPDLKPKEPTSLVIHRDTYREDNERMVEELREYDAGVKHYNQTRTGRKSDNDWCAHILGYYDEVVKLRIFDYLRAQGFDVTV